MFRLVKRPPGCVGRYLPSALSAAVIYNQQLLLRYLTYITALSRPRINMSRLATTPPPPQPPELIGFYSGTHSDRNGRSLESVLAYSAEKLERHHDYIQTLFPLPERSAIDPHAPIIDEPVFKAFHSDPNLRANLLKAFKRILWFYGFELDKRENGNVVVSSP